VQPHDVLGVSPAATAGEVTDAFRRFALRNHPDRGGDADRFRAGTEAYRRLLASARAAGATTARAGPTFGPRPDVVFHRRPRSGLAAMFRRARSTLARPRS